MEQVSFDPGIQGFIKAHRHPTGSALVMATIEDGDHDWIEVYWVKRLAHNSTPISGDRFRILNDRTLRAAERCYNFHLVYGPPPAAIPDSQRRRVYDWEDTYIFPGHEQEMTWEGCLYFLNYVWSKVGKGPPPILSNWRRVRTAASLGGEIHLPGQDRLYWSKPILLHEIAHELVQDDHAHGPVFVSVYIDLVVRFLGLSRQALEQSAVRYGVRNLDIRLIVP